MFARVLGALTGGFPPAMAPSKGALPSPETAAKLFGDLKQSLSPLIAALKKEDFRTLDLVPLVTAQRGILARIETAPGGLPPQKQDAARSLKDAIEILDQRVHDIENRKLLGRDASIQSVRLHLAQACLRIVEARG